MLNRFQIGDALRDIARDYNYDIGNLSRRFKKAGVVQGELQPLLKKQYKKAMDIASAITPAIQRRTTPIQQEGLKKILTKRAEQLLTINEITDVALKLHKNLLIQVNNLAAKGNYKPHEAASVLRTLGMSYDSLLKQMGIEQSNPDKPPEGEGVKTYEISNDPVQAAQDYQALINDIK